MTPGGDMSAVIPEVHHDHLQALSSKNYGVVRGTLLFLGGGAIVSCWGLRVYSTCLKPISGALQIRPYVFILPSLVGRLEFY